MNPFVPEPTSVQTFSLKVTEDDILHGVRRDCFNCPIARALVRKFPGYLVEVFPTEAILTLYDRDRCVQRGWIQLSKRATSFVNTFDTAYNLTKPSTFRLKVSWATC